MLKRRVALITSLAAKMQYEAIREAGTEFAQSLANIGIDLIDGTMDWAQVPDRLKQELNGWAAAAVIGGTAGVGAGIYNRSRGIKIIKEELRGAVPEEDLERTAAAVFDSAAQKVSDVVSVELELSSELQTKHGAVVDSMRRAIKQAFDESGAFTDVDEDTLAQNVEDTAKLFADQVLAEATQRNVPIEEVIKASDIVYENGEIRLKNKEEKSSVSQEKLYQRAFAGSRVDYERPSLEAIGSGEGNQAHGWGLYYALDKDVAERYREDFERDNYFFDEDKLEVERQKQEKSGNFNKTELLEDLLIHHDESNLGNFSDEVVDWYKKEIRPNVLNKNYRKTQVHEVEIPENPFLLDEQLPFSEQPETVKQGIKNAIKEISEDAEKQIQALENKDFIGREIYNKISLFLAKTPGTLADKETSLLLEKYGIKGITYDGKEDGRAFVIFNPDDVEVIQKFYQLPQDNLENAVKITGKEFGEYEGDDKAYIAKAKQWYRKNLAGNYATSPVIGEVNFYNRQFSETKDKNIKNIENLKYLPAVRKIIETSTNVQEEKPNHFRGDDIVQFYRIMAPVNINGEFNNISVLVAEDRQRRKYYTLENKGLVQDTSVERGLAQAQKGNSFYDINIYVNKENVKKNNNSKNLKPKGLYDAKKGVIKIFESADFSTLPHELAHYWLDNMWHYVRSGNASEKYRQRWNVIANWLNVKQEQAFLTRGQQEKFARGYEQYLLNGNLPTPIIKGAFDDYDRWLKRVYGDMNRLNVRHIDYKKASR